MTTYPIHIPTIELVRRYFCQYPIGTLVGTSVRRLAKAVGRSEGQMTVHLDQLEADGWIRRLADHTGTVVEVLRTDQPHDRPLGAPESDHVAARPSQSDHAAAMPIPASAPAAPAPRSDHADDPPHTPLYGIKHDSSEQQQLGARAPLFERLQEAGAAESVALEILHKNPALTIAEFEAMRSAAKRRGDHRTPEAIGLVFWCLQTGQPLYMPKEPTHGPGYTGDRGSHGTQSHAGSNDRRDGARGGARGGPSGRGEKRDKYGVGAAYRSGPADSDLPPFLRAARERSRQERERQAAGGA